MDLLRGRRVVGAVLTALVLAGACGNSDDDGGSAATSTAAETTSSEADDGATTSAPDGDGTADGDDGGAGSGERDTFVPLEGVPGVTDEEIAFVAIGTNSNNPLGTCVLDCYVDGIEAYFAWRNDEGGIYGRQLVLADAIDDELARNLERSQEVAGSDSYFGVFQAVQVASGWGVLNDAGVPQFVWGIHSTEAANREAIWGHIPPGCFGCTNRYVPYMMREAGKTTVASLGYGISENSKVCAGALRDSVEKYSAELGIEVGYFNDDLAFGLPNGIGPEVTAMKDAGVDFIATCIDLNGMKTLGEELQRQGMDDVVMYHPNTYNQEFVAENAAIFEGDFILPQFAPFEYETGLEMQVKFKEYMESTGSELSELAMIGWINADQAFQGLLAAGPEFDRRAVIDAINSMTAYDAGGLIVPIDWTRQHTPSTEGDPTYEPEQECVAITRVVDGRITPYGDDITKPFVCWPNDTLDWSEPVPTSFGGD